MAKKNDNADEFKNLNQSQIAYLKALKAVDAELEEQRSILEGTKSIVDSITSVFNLNILSYF